MAVKIAPDAGDRVLFATIDGALDAEDVAQLAAAFDERHRGGDKVSVGVEIVRFGGIAPDALLADLKFALKHWQDVDRKAVLSDGGQLARLAAAAGNCFPGIEVKAFPLGDRQAALDWLHRR